MVAVDRERRRTEVEAALWVSGGWKGDGRGVMLVKEERWVLG